MADQAFIRLVLNMRYGDFGDEVKALQRALQIDGVFPTLFSGHPHRHPSVSWPPVSIPASEDGHEPVASRPRLPTILEDESDRRNNSFGYTFAIA